MPSVVQRRIGLRIVVAVVAVAALLVVWRARSWPDVAALARENPRTTAFIEAWRERRRAGGESDRPEWRWVTYDAISPHLKRAVLVGEDVNFFSHHGFEPAELKHALGEAWEARELPRGASTISQQLAKNLWLSPSYDPLRKLEEALLTRQLEAAVPKKRILEVYLNVVEFGPGVYGAEAAARRYFDKSAADLSEAEAARLAASLPNPGSWNPARSSRTAARHAALIERRMEKAAFLWRQI